MRIEQLREVNANGVSRVMADVIWEDCARPPFELFFETRGTDLELSSNPHAFLVACLLPAMQFGERRIKIAEEICPELLDGLAANMDWHKAWSGGQLQPVPIECDRSRKDLGLRSGRGVGSFLSGGIDSLATLRKNRLDFPLDHRASIHDCVVVHGFDIGGTSSGGSEQAFFDRSATTLSEIARDAEVRLIPVATNVRLLYDDVAFWMDYFHGAALASVAHVLDRRIWRMHIASSFTVPSESPWGSHPLTDGNYSSQAMQLKHDGLHLTRLDKVRLVADWDAAVANLRVCFTNPTTGLNCGTCEKCIRTMLELLAVGKLEAAKSFPKQHIEPELLDSLHIEVDYEVEWYEEVMQPLAAQGHREIVERIEGMLADYQKRRAWEREEDWKGTIKRFDRRFLGSSLYRTWKAVRPNILKLTHRESRL